MKWGVLDLNNKGGFTYGTKHTKKQIPSLRRRLEAWVPSGRLIFCLKDFRHFRSNIRSSIENECCSLCTVDNSTVNFTNKRNYTTRASGPKHEIKNRRFGQMVRAFSKNPKVGGLSPHRVKTFSVSKPQHFHMNTPWWIENEWCCVCQVDISNDAFTNKSIYSTVPIVPKHEALSDPGSSNC